ncbi:unnamed protein product [Lactuca virosa]|uniref:AB hydrolase-1 domain-containing protein n=1 Tax=Lactuca virosa TaxID=75947 RepID=A0AAU9NBQ2_9ASTR|nr:unnamed protein product [Lactuca virosa]
MSFNLQKSDEEEDGKRSQKEREGEGGTSVEKDYKSKDKSTKGVQEDFSCKKIQTQFFFCSSKKGFTRIYNSVLFMGFLARAFQSFRPPPPKTCGSQDGPPITSPRIKLRDGRHLSYMEHGIPKETAKFKIIYIHGFDNCKEINIFALAASPALIEELGVYTVSFDRPGYGESDPHPERTLKSLALDIDELADQLQLGSKFYLAGLSMGGLLVWPCLKYIPHRLAGVVFISPGVNYWWPSFPSKLCNEVYYEMFKTDQWALRVVHHLPWLNYWWNTQKMVS